MGFFGRKRAPSVPHPRKEPRFDGPLTLESLGRVFEGVCGLYGAAGIPPWGPGAHGDGVLSAGYDPERAAERYILRPLAQDPALSRAPEEELFSLLQYGALYNLAANRRTALEDVVNDLILGSCACFSPGGPMYSPCRCHRGEALWWGSRRTNPP